MKCFKTEITSDHIVSDKPLHERLLFPYVQIASQLKGEVLELGCGWGRGVAHFQSDGIRYTGVDKNKVLIDELKIKHPDCHFKEVTLPDLSAFATHSFDHIIAFQVIEHIEDDELFLEEIHRILRPGGKLHLSTINRRFSISRNPWHIREYDSIGLTVLLKMFFFVIQLSDTGTGFSLYIHIVKLSIEVFYSCHNGGLSELCVNLPLIVLDIFFFKKKLSFLSSKEKKRKFFFY